MARQPEPERYDSKTFGRRLQLRVLPDVRRPALKTKDEAALMGGVALATDIKENRLRIDRLEEENVQPTNDLAAIWPQNLYGISVPGHVDVVRSQQTIRRPISLPQLLDGVPNGESLVHNVTFEFGGDVDPRQFCELVKQRWGPLAAERLKPGLIDNQVKAAAKEGRIKDPDDLYVKTPGAKQWLITLYGPHGEPISSADRLDELDGVESAEED